MRLLRRRITVSVLCVFIVITVGCGRKQEPGDRDATPETDGETDASQTTSPPCRLVYEIFETGSADSEVIRQTADVVRRRLLNRRIPAQVELDGRRLTVRLPDADVTEVLRAQRVIEPLGKLELRMIIDDAEYETLPEAEKRNIRRMKMVVGSLNPVTGKMEETQTELWVKMSDPYNVTGDDISSVRQGQDQFGAPAVDFALSGRGSQRFYELTKFLVDKGARLGRKQRLGILLNDELQSAPTVVEAIAGGRALITGKFTRQEVNDLIAILKAGALPARMVLVEEFMPVETPEPVDRTDEEE